MAAPNPSALTPCWDPSRTDCPGHDPRKCKGHSNGRPCKQYPNRGVKVCASHGGNAPQVKAAAKRNLAEDSMRKKLGRLTSVPVTNPLVELQILAGKAKAWMDVCEQHMAELERLRYSSAEGGEHIRGEVVLFERALEACRKVLVDQARLDIDERLAAITDRQVRQAFEIVRLAVGRLGLVLGEEEVAAAVQGALAEMGAVPVVTSREVAA